MQEKQFLAEGCRLALTKYRWNSQNQLTGLITPDGIAWEYRYDAFGRRIEKRCIQSGKRTTYVWDGDVPAEIREYQHGRLKMIRHLVFDGWELIAQQTQQFTLNLDNRVELMAGEVQTQYAVSAPTGEPLALFDPAGKRVWRRPKQSLYGLRLGGHGENPQLDPGLRFAGQLFDEESGLFYNRFRYYLPEAACYLSPDPWGLAGGVNPYSYVHNPTGWIDPFGLAGKNCQDVGNKSKNAQEMAEELANQLNKNTVTFSTPTTMGHIDLRGRAHFDKITQTDIPTPHVQTSPINIAPNGKRFPLKKQEVARPATKQDIRTARELAKKQGILK
nr:RHS repeat-associated core domain-containing protein [Photorhabdus hainanensis]